MVNINDIVQQIVDSQGRVYSSGFSKLSNEALADLYIQLGLAPKGMESTQRIILLQDLNSGRGLSEKQKINDALSAYAIANRGNLNLTPSNLVPPINPTVMKSDNVTPTGPTIPEYLLPAGYGRLSIFSYPEEVYKEIIPKLIPGTPEYQAAMDKLSTAYFDVMQQQMNASTAQQQEAANYNWQELKRTIETNLGITLSNDAYQAWDQIQSLGNQASAQNIKGSGIENESIDNYLNKIRRADTVTRNEAQTKQEAADQNYYTKFATPQKIKELIEKNPALAKSWGLVPSDEIRAAMNPAALKAKYPTMSDKDIQRYIASILDENGNYRSALYQKHIMGSSLGANKGSMGEVMYDENGNPISVGVNPSDTGIQDIEASKEWYQGLNTPLANLLADYNKRVETGTIRPTAGKDPKGGADTTLFNDIPSNPNANAGTGPNGTITDPMNIEAKTAADKAAADKAAADKAAADKAAADAAQRLGTQGTGTTSPTTTPKKKYNTLYDYYTANGGWNTWNSARRQADVAKAGISNYAGTAAQNTALLNWLNNN